MSPTPRAHFLWYFILVSCMKFLKAGSSWRSSVTREKRKRSQFIPAPTWLQCLQLWCWAWIRALWETSTPDSSWQIFSDHSRPGGQREVKRGRVEADFNRNGKSSWVVQRPKNPSNDSDQHTRAARKQGMSLVIYPGTSIHLGMPQP